MKNNPTPQLVFELDMLGLGDLICASDKDLPIGNLRRAFWFVRGAILTSLFGWWVWK